MPALQFLLNNKNETSKLISTICGIYTKAAATKVAASKAATAAMPVVKKRQAKLHPPKQLPNHQHM